MPSAKKTAYPLPVKAGNTSVIIYKGKSGGLPFYTLTWREGTRRLRQGFRQPKKAEQQAEIVATRLESGHRTAARMNNADADSFGQAVATLRPLNVPLNVAVQEYAAARKLLDGASIVEAARFYAARRPTQSTTLSAHDAVEAFLIEKKGDGVGIRYLQDARSRLRRFSKTFVMPLSGITTAAMGEWLRQVAPHPRTRNNFRQHLVTLFRWARDKGYLPRETETEADRLKATKDRGGDVKIFSPAALEKLLQAADEKLKPYLAIRAFAGVRDSEMRRLTWANVKFNQGVIEIKAQQAKTASRRLIPILPNLDSWLQKCRENTGRIGYANSERMAGKLAKDIAVEWVHNGLRHGFGSHRLADIKNAAQVAHEMGNTERMVHQFYKELVTEAEGKAWFAIAPEAPKKILRVKRKRAA